MVGRELISNWDLGSMGKIAEVKMKLSRKLNLPLRSHVQSSRNGTIRYKANLSRTEITVRGNKMLSLFSRMCGV